MFDYFYGNQADQFSFYRMPRSLFTNETFKGLSDGAKILYGLMLDRLSLSLKNGWQDKDGRTYIIFTVAEIMDMLSCAEGKTVKMLSELDCKKGIGLIEIVKRGQGKPSIIYIKTFW